MRKQKNTSLLEMQPGLLESVLKRFVNLAINKRCYLIKLLQDKENLINKIWNRCVLVYLLAIKFPIVKKSIFSMLVSPLKNNWMTLTDKLILSNPEDLNTIHIHVLQMLLQELISQEKDCQYYWKPVYNTISEKLLLPIKTDYHDLDLTLFNSSFKKQEENLQSLTMKKINLQNKNCQKTFYQLSTSTAVAKWEKEAIKNTTIQKSLKIKLHHLTTKQKTIFNEWINTCNYIYNKTIEHVNNGCKPDFYSLRDILITKNTKKNNIEYKQQEDIIKHLQQKHKLLLEDDKIKESNKLIDANKKLLKQIAKTLQSEKNILINDWEYNTPKDIRAGAVNDVCKAYKTAFTNLKNNNIKRFNISFRKHHDRNKSIVIPKNLIQICNNKIKLAPSYLKNECYLNIANKTLKKHKNITIDADCRLLKQYNDYWLIIPITVQVKQKSKLYNYCGIDPGIRTFMTTFGNKGCNEYNHNSLFIDKLNKSIFYLKSLRTKECHNKRKALNKREIKKENIINDLHWKTINQIINTNDVIFYGDIKSHNIVKNGKNKILNRNFNDLKFYKFKERLLYKAAYNSKLMYSINESYTTQCCSTCGTINNPGSSKIYHCHKCVIDYDRDINAAKNILLKGLVSYLL